MNKILLKQIKEFLLKQNLFILSFLFFTNKLGLNKINNPYINNIIISCHEKRRDTIVSVLPATVKINTGYKCNLKCPLCPTGRGESPSKNNLDIKNYKIIIERLDMVKKILLFGWGEPLLNKNIFELISYTKSCGKYVAMDSNLNIADEKKLKKLVKSGLDFLSVSIDGVNQQSYEKYRKGGNFNLVIENIKKLQFLKRKYQKRTPIIEWQYCVNKYNEDYTEQAKKIAGELGIGIKFIPIGLYLEAINAPNVKSANEWLPTKDLTATKNQHVANNKNSLSTPITTETYYHDLYQVPFIDTDCSVYLCCLAPVATKKNSLINDNYITCAGNLKENDFYEIFNNHIYQSARSIFNPKNSKSGEIKTICNICRYFKKN